MFGREWKRKIEARWKKGGREEEEEEEEGKGWGWCYRY
jgi:hypothetical protein